ELLAKRNGEGVNRARGCPDVFVSSFRREFELFRTGCAGLGNRHRILGALGYRVWRQDIRRSKAPCAADENANTDTAGFALADTRAAVAHLDGFAAQHNATHIGKGNGAAMGGIKGMLNKAFHSDGLRMKNRL